MYLTVEQIAERLQVSKETVKRWLRSGQLSGYALGDRAGWRVTEDDLAAFLATRKTAPAPKSERRRETRPGSADVEEA